MHFLLKKATEQLLVRSGLPRLARLRRRGSTLVLAYHNIIPAGERTFGDRSLHLPQREFAAQLDVIADTCDVIPLAGIFESATSSSHPRIILTFDDAYQGALTAGLHELAARNLPATVFVSPAFVGGRSFWWDDFAAARAGELSEEFRDFALNKLCGQDQAIRSWAAEQGVAPAAVAWHECAANEQQLHKALDRTAICLASHTWSHPNLARLQGAALKSELETPMTWLQERFRRVLPWISYPYGLHSAATEQAAASAGYDGALLIRGGWISDAPGRYAIARLNVPAGISAEGFSLRTSGVLH